MLAAIGVPAVLCIVIGVLPTIAIQMIEPVNRLVAGEGLFDAGGHGGWVWLAPASAFGNSYSGLMMFLTIMILTILAVFMIHRYASNRVRRSIAWGCGFTDPAPLGQYSADSFSQPLRRVFAGHLFRTRDRVDMPAPGETRPARFTLELRDPAWDWMFTPDHPPCRLDRRPDRCLAVPHHPQLPVADVLRPDRAPGHGGGVAMMVVQALLAGVFQVIQMALVLMLAPGLTGLVRVVKARLVGRRGPPLVQPYRDLLRLLKKEVVLAENASWLFRTTPYLVFTAIWLAAALVPTFSTALALTRHRRSDSAGGPARQRPLLPGARRDGCRDQLRRAGIVAGNDDRGAGGAGHADGDLLRRDPGADHIAVPDRGFHAERRRRPAGVAGAGADLAPDGRHRGKRPRPDRQPGHPS